MVEFVLVAAFFFVPLILGLLSYGFSLSRSLHVAQLSRDVGRMFVRGVDFSEQGNQELLTGSSSRRNLPALAAGLGLQINGTSAIGSTSGNGVLILSTLTRMPSTCNCVNADRIVLTRRVVVGNRNLFSSSFGAPAATLVDAPTGIVRNYASDPSARADSFSSVVNLSGGELAYLIETRFRFPDLAIPGFYSDPGTTWRSVF
jgi:hypothetical protein